MRSEKSEVRKGKKPRAARPEALSDFSLHTSHFVVPRLRFPEFWGTAEWAISDLGSVADFVNEKIAVSKLNPRDYISTENLLPDYGETVASTRLPDVPAVTRYKSRDVLISNIRPYLKKVWHANRDGGASNDVIVLRAKPPLSDEFLSLVLRNDAFIAYVMESAKGVKMPRGDLIAMRAYPVGRPAPAEQQKIADCLTSLDEVIAAQGRKVEALKAHKRGLMQQLFPREGETLPRLRFPEFRDAPEWKRGKASDIVDVLQGYGFPERLQGSREGEFPFYKVSDISACVDAGGNLLDEANNHIDADVLEELRAKLMPVGSTVFAKIGEAIRSNKRAITSRPCLVDNNAAGVKAIERLAHDRFVYYLWCQIPLIEYAGGVVPAVNKSAIEQISVCYPKPDEQQRIADCLSALDTQITAESDQLATLKTHKLGLMQQLFPAPAEADT